MTMRFTLFLVPLFILLSFTTTGAEFIGSEACGSCHEQEMRNWQLSDHSKSMAVANQENVLGDFSDTLVEFHNIESTFSTLTKNNKTEFFIETTNQAGKPEKLKIKYTFGYFPLQQYLVELDNGHIQALNIAWDAREKKSGGQRWFHLQPDQNVTPEHPFFWTRHLQNWNSRCADCHSTNVEKNYSPQNHSYNTLFSEINVACEACHGPASRHVSLAHQNKLTAEHHGLETTLPQKQQWKFKNNNPIAIPSGISGPNEVNMCGRCHSLRVPLEKHSHEQDFLDSNIVQPLSSSHYFPDGQIKEEVFVLGSFMQSKMFDKGVTCSNCHNPHTGKTITEGNQLCGQCHAEKTYNSKKHHQHTKNSDGAECVNCHMPERTYMGVDKRRDHSFTIPKPSLSAQLDVPISCANCHKDKDQVWISESMKNWGMNIDSKDHWASTLKQVERNNVLAIREAIKKANDPQLSDYTRASLLTALSSIPSRVGIEYAQTQLLSKSPLIRKAAVESLQNAPPEIRWKTLSPFLNDKNRAVRFQLAETLADLKRIFPQEDTTQLDQLIDEYKASLSLSLDSPATRLNLANLEIKLGNFSSAENELNAALKIEPNYIPALINMADFNRSTGNNTQVETLLKRALEIEPKSGAAQHSYGLFLIRNKDYVTALPYLKGAIDADDASARFNFVYAIALDHNKQTDEAVQVLTVANQIWPHQYDLLMLQISLLDKLNQQDDILPYLSKLSAIAPSSPDVKKLIQKHSR